MRIAFTSLTKLIWAIDIDGGNLVELTNGLGGRNPVWQPVLPFCYCHERRGPVVGTDQIAAFNRYSLIAPRP